MPSERVQRQINRFLDDAETAMAQFQWETVRDCARAVLGLDAENADALTFLTASERNLGSVVPTAPSLISDAESPSPARAAEPTSFASGRYTVKRFLGEGGKKKVYLAHDALLDRDVAFALIKTEGLDDASRIRITREAQAMGRLGDHPNIVTVYDIGEENGAPYMVLPVLAGGDVEGVIEKAPEQRMPLERALKIAIETCRGLEFAHGRGIVHRDLKPGNVWLSEDGTAKIGDFGLAVATDRSRLTQAGMMVGTVSYMPPEQAIGGEVGPRSDLYSLGAMLYEMVCGRPPFVGDESVAIIGQHLNTPPVAPTWHRPDCPPALETLILRLLEKDPSKRPASASEVREALESVSGAGQSGSRAVGQGSPSAAEAPPGDNPLYRRTFVGREAEVKQLQAAFDAALSGQGGLVMVVGEPGIGKTALCEQLATYVALRGGKALVGHCYEEGSLSLPYLAFVEAMRSYVLAREPDGLRSDLGTGAADVARIVSEVRDRVQGVELRPAGDPEDDRWRLLQAIISFLRNASTVQPLCIVLEDLHWADRGTLDLLLHVARNLQGARLLVVGTYRDVEVDRSHPLSATLAELSRATSYQRVRLRGLTVDEVHRMYQTIRGQDVPWNQAEAIHRQTEGNPLFVQEVLRYLVEEGIVVREGGRWVRTDGGEPGAGVPEGLRDVIGRRLSRLSGETNRVLAIAAVVGRDFNLATVRVIAESEDDLLATSLDEAVKVGVLEERGQVGGAVNYRFAHAFFRQTLYEELGAARRIRLHQQVGRALEDLYRSRVLDHAAELAEHFSHSSDSSDLAKAVSYGEAAAQRAISVFDYGEAARLLERAIDVQEVLDADDEIKLCSLLLALGEAMLPQQDPRRVADGVAERAFALATSVRDSNLATRAALQALESFERVGPETRESPKYDAWVGRLEQQSSLNTAGGVYAVLYRGFQVQVVQRDNPAGWHIYLRRAAQMAIELGDKPTLFAISGWAMGPLRASRDTDLRERLANEILQADRDSVRSRDLGTCLAFAGRILLARGDRMAAERVWGELAQLASTARDVSLAAYSSVPPAYLAFLDGRLEEALSLADAVDAQAEALGVRSIDTGVELRQSSMYYLGRESLLLLQTFTTANRYQAARRPLAAITAVVLARLGRRAEAMALRAPFGDLGRPEDESASGILVLLLELSNLCGDLDSTQTLSALLAPFADRLTEAATGIGVGMSMGRLLGEASAVLGKPNEARGYYAKGLEVCTKVRFRPEIALIRLDLAELLLEHYTDERDAAIEHLDFAIAELRDMKMQPALERALRHRGLLKA